MAELVLRPMRPRHRARGPRVWPALLVGLLVASGLSQWFGGLYVAPPADGSAGGTSVVWRAAGEPFFNSPGVPGFERGPAGHVLTDRLPFWGYAYRQSLETAARAETVTVGASSAPAAATPTPAPNIAATPAPAPRVAATPAPKAPVTPTSVTAERDRRLGRIRQEMERIRREGAEPSSAGSKRAGTGG